MADVKISQLPAATTPVDGTEVLPIVQSATTKQVSIANLTAGRAMTASSLTLSTPLAVTSGGTGLATTAQGTLLSSTALNTISATATPTLGVAGTTAGTLGLSGVTSGVVTLATADAAGTWTMKLPTSGGTNGYILTTNGSGVTSWTNPTALGIDLDVGTTAITNGTTGRVLYNNAGVLGEYSSLPVSFGGTGLTSFGTGVATALGNAVNGASGLCVQDASGNLGLGVTPSSWSQGRAFEIGNIGYGLWNGGSSIYVAANTYFNGGFKYGNTGSQASHYYQYQGAHIWSTAPSGTVGNAISFTQAMTLDANGRLGIGTSGPTATIDIRGTAYLQLTSNATNAAAFTLTNQTVSSNNGCRLVMDAYNIGTVAIGVPSDAAALSFYPAHPNAEKMRLTSNGELLIGTTTVVAPLTVVASKSGISAPVAWVRNTNSSGAVMALYTSLESNGNSTSSAHMNCVTQLVNNWYLYGNGTTSFSSDERLKKDIETARNGYLDDVMKLRVVKYRWHNQDEDTPQELGFIAQEMEQVFPGLVIEHELEGVGVRKNIKHSVMEFILTKAIQELAAKVSALEAKQ